MSSTAATFEQATSAAPAPAALRRTRQRVPLLALEPAADMASWAYWRLWLLAPALWLCLAMALALGLTGLWVLRSPVFTVRAVQLQSMNPGGQPLGRTDLQAITQGAKAHLQGQFFALDLPAARKSIEALPWVRKAEVRRVWPDSIAVRVEEHEPVALWEGAAGADRVVNRFGEVFDADLPAAEAEVLPWFAGPEGSAATVKALWTRLAAAYAERDMPIGRLQLNARGTWRAELKNGAVVELGRGTDDEIVARNERFLRSVGGLTQRRQQAFEYADLRHQSGYALRLAGGAAVQAAVASGEVATASTPAAAARAGSGLGAAPSQQALSAPRR